MNTLLCRRPFFLALSSGPHSRVEGGVGGVQKSSGFSGMCLSNRYFRPPDERYLIPHLVCMCVCVEMVGMERLWCQESWEFTLAAPPSVSGRLKDNPRHLNQPIRHNPIISSRLNNQLKLPFILTMGGLHY